MYSSNRYLGRKVINRYGVPLSTHKGLKKIMKNTKYILSSLIILLTGVIYFSVQAQQKNEVHRANFSGEWKSNQSIGMGGNIVCSYVEGDRMNSETMKIAEQADFLVIETPNPSPGSTKATSPEKLAFDGKEGQINHGQGNEKKFTLKLSADGQTMTIKSIVYFMAATPYHVNVMKKAFTDVTEVWTLSNDGQSITIQSIAKSNIWDRERSWKTVFNKVN